MCGIGGMVNFSGNKVAYDIIALRAALAHRGPDGKGIWSDECTTFVHNRLAIIDLSEQASQPMVNQDGNYVIVFNGEIYNFKSLRQELEEKYTFRSESDTEVLLYAYQEWGENCLNRLNGMFAFSIWNTKTKELFAARDHFGIKPLYYYLNNGTLIFASEIKGIIASGVSPEYNLPKVYDFIRWGAHHYSEETFFKNIMKLDAGHFIKFGSCGLKKLKYYSLEEHVDETRPIDHETATRQFTTHLDDSIRLRLISDREIGTHLSGGIDSTAVCARASVVAGHRLQSYTYGYEEEQFDERPFARLIAENFSSNHHESLLTASEFVEMLPTIVRSQDEPFTSVRVASHHKLYSDFKKSGTTVILEAGGGEELGAGYASYLWPWYLDFLQEHGPAKANREIFALLRGNDEAGTDSQIDNALHYILGCAAQYHLPGTTTSDGIPYLDVSVLAREFSESYQRAFPEYARPFKSHLLNATYIDLTYHKLPRFLTYVDRASMAAGREARVPFLDRRMVEFGFSTALSAKINNGEYRSFIKSATQKMVPGNSLPNKRGVVDPQKFWLRGPLSEAVGDIFSSQSFRQRNVFDADNTRKVFDDFRNSGPNSNSFGIFQIFSTELWFRYVDSLNSSTKSIL